MKNVYRTKIINRKSDSAPEAFERTGNPHFLLSRWQVWAAGCEAIAHIQESLRLGKQCETLGRAGACEVMVTALRTFPEHQKVGPSAFFAIYMLASNSVKNRESLCKAGACEVVMAAFRANPTGLLAVHGCSVIKVLAKSDEACRALGRDGACELVVGFLRKPDRGWANLYPMGHVACGAIESLARLQDNHSALSHAGAREAVTTAMHACHDDIILQQAGDRAIEALKQLGL
jgi:hypothetical protein